MSAFPKFNFKYISAKRCWYGCCLTPALNFFDAALSSDHIGRLSSSDSTRAYAALAEVLKARAEEAGDTSSSDILPEIKTLKEPAIKKREGSASLTSPGWDKKLAMAFDLAAQQKSTDLEGDLKAKRKAILTRYINSISQFIPADGSLNIPAIQASLKK